MVAIGVVAAAIVVGVVVTRSGGGPKSGGPVSTRLVRAGDLGNLSDAQALRARVEPALGRTSVAPSRSPAASLPRCEQMARAMQPGNNVLVYVAAARWQGMAVDVYGFSPAGAPPSAASHRAPVRVYVVARSDCRLVVFQSFSP